MTKKKTESAAAAKTAPSAAAERAAESLPVIKIGAPTAADMGALATFALEGHGRRCQWSGSETSKARVMHAKLVEYRLREVAPKDTKEAVAAENAATFAKMREELKKPNPCPNRVRDLSYKLRAHNPPRSALFVTDKGWEELAKLGISQKTASKVCGQGIEIPSAPVDTDRPLTELPYVGQREADGLGPMAELAHSQQA